jgi:hypothetical protein
MIKYRDGFWKSIKEFVFKITRKEHRVAEKEFVNVTNNIENLPKNNKQGVYTNIAMPNNEMTKLLMLQKQYKNGDISEEDLTPEEYSQLVNLYKKQNKEMYAEIEREKVTIRKRLDELKAQNS